MRDTGRELLIAVTAVVLAAMPARAGFPPVNAEQLKCEVGMSKGFAKFVGSKVKCLTKCQQAARNGVGPFSDCSPPYNGSTLICIADPLKGVEAKAIVKIQKACLLDCPACYSGGDCASHIPARVFDAETQVDAYSNLLWCDDSGSGDGLTPGEAKCQDATAKTFGKFVKSKSKCYDKCVANEFKGNIPAGSCVPPASDPATINCIILAESKAAEAIDKICMAVNGVPECYAPSLDTGIEWVSIWESLVDANDAQTYCPGP